MSILSKIIGGATVEPIQAIGGVVTEIFGTKDRKLSHEEFMVELAQRPQLAQAAISQSEAQHRSVFVAGARPAILWICAGGLAFAFIINPLIQWFTGDPGPELPLEQIISLVVATLGLGVYRTVEKLNGRAK